MKKYLISVLLTSLLTHPFAFAGQDYVLDSPTRFIVDGFISEKTVRDLNLALQNNPKLREIEFRNSYGAPENEITVTQAMIGLIEKNQLQTYAKGNCAFACATIFLMGEQPCLLIKSSGRASRLILRPLVSRDGEFLKEETELFFNKIVVHSKGKIPAIFLSWLYKVNDELGALHIWSEVKSPAKYIQFQANSKSEYENISDLHPTDLGIRIANSE